MNGEEYQGGDWVDGRLPKNIIEQLVMWNTTPSLKRGGKSLMRIATLGDIL